MFVLGCGSDTALQPPPGDGAPVDGLTTGDDGPRPVRPWSIVGDATGIQRLERFGANLFEGVGGYYIIGSCTGADDANNVTSQGSDGHTLRAPGSCPGAPFSLAVTGDNPYHVTISIGPLPAAYRTLSVPLDPRKDLLDAFAFAGSAYQVGCGTSFQPRSGSGAAFATIPTPCTIPNVGGVGLARVVPVPGSGEIAGPLGTIRRRILSGDAKELDFFNHPGTNNIEVGFADPFAQSIPAGTVVHLEELIELVDPAVVPPVTRHEVEGRTFGHEIGRREGEGWSADTNLDRQGFLAFGPYLSLSPGAFTADFRLLVDNNTADDLEVVRIEAAETATGHVLAKREIRRRDFAAANAFQDFSLSFGAPGGTGEIELRTFWYDRAYVRQDRVELHWPQ